MSDFIPWDDIELGDYLPNCIARVEWEELEVTTTSTDKMMFKATFTVVEPEEYANRKHFENFVVGTDENPGGFNTKTFGAKALNRARIAAQVKPVPSPDELCDYIMAERPQLLLQFREPTEARKDEGYYNNTISNYFAIGDRDVGLTADRKAVSKTKPAPKPPVKKSAPKPPAPKPAAKPAPKPPARKPAPVEPEVVEEYEDAGEETAQEAAAPASQENVYMIPCPICQQEVPAVELGTHMATHS
jgi:hypothetical protein